MLGNEVIAHLDVAAEAPALPELAEVAISDDPLVTNGRAPLVARVPTGTPLPVGALVPISIGHDSTHLFDAASHTAGPRPVGI